MAVEIKQMHSEAYKVNGKAVIKNEMGDWLAPFHTLSSGEWDAFYKHLYRTTVQSDLEDLEYPNNKRNYLNV